jgi:hypothetical protein
MMAYIGLGDFELTANKYPAANREDIRNARAIFV